MKRFHWRWLGLGIVPDQVNAFILPLIIIINYVHVIANVVFKIYEILMTEAMVFI